MCTHISIFFRTSLYSADSCIVKVRIGSPKTAWPKFVRTISHTGSNFFQNVFEAFMPVMDCSCAHILFFSAASDGAAAYRQIPDRIFGQFLTSLWKDSIANYALIWTLFPRTVRGLDCALQRTKRFVVPSVGGATRYANLRRKFSKTQKNRQQSCAKYFG